MSILDILFTTGIDYGHKGRRYLGCEGRFYNRTGWDHGGGHVRIPSSLGLIPNYVVLVLGNEGVGPHHMQGHHTRGLGIGLRKLVGFGVEYSSHIQLRLFFLFFSLYLF